MWDVTGSTVKIIGQLGFLLTHPVWDVTMTGGIDVNRLTGFLLTHPVWDVTVSGKARVSGNAISTHTSRVGCDSVDTNSTTWYSISTHTSRVGCDCL